MKQFKFLFSLLLLTFICWQPVLAQSDIEITDSTSTEWGDEITGGLTPSIPYYKLTYMVDGEEYRQVSVASGSIITPLDTPTKEGYSFTGWSGLPETMPAQDVVVAGRFVANSYEIIYMINGETFKTEYITFGTTITAPEAPTKEGHTFGGWIGLPSTMPAQDVTVIGSFTPNSYTVTYILDDETFKTESITYGTDITTPEVPAKEGYTFSGWGDVPVTMPASDLTFNGSYTVNTYTLIYKVDGVGYKTVSLAYGSTIIAEAAPTKEGHTFSGWSEIPATMPAQDVTVTGTFTANSYTVTYILDGETFKTEQVTYGTAIATPTVPVKQGYNFSGWGEVPATMPAQDLTFTGSYTINKDNVFSLIYMVDGREYTRVSVAFGDPIVLDVTPEKEGYTFSGWSEAPETMPFNSVTVYGTFSVNSYLLTFVLEGEVYQQDSVAYGTTITVPEVPAKEGYTFSGWGDVPATMPASDLTFNGSYIVNTYTLIYKVDGEEFKSVTLEYGASIPTEDEPEKEGHTFSGWGDVPETMPAGDVTVEGTFTVNKYQITYLVDGEVYATDSIAYGESIALIEEPVKDGHIFSGWSEVPETMPAEDVEVTGGFASGITVIFTQKQVDVYSLQGVLIRKSLPVEDLMHELPRGIYIVNGEKILVK